MPDGASPVPRNEYPRSGTACDSIVFGGNAVGVNQFLSDETIRARLKVCVTRPYELSDWTIQARLFR
jgi:hypothetical protein